MPKRSLRTRSKKRQTLRLPGGRTGTHYTREKIKSQRCARCEKPLSGIPRLISSGVRKLPASQRKIERPYGNLLCPTCLQESLKQAVRGS
jgi:large subunit ribosomal protein L34e